MFSGLSVQLTGDVAGPGPDASARVAGVPRDLSQISKRSVHRGFDVWVARAAIRAGTKLQALAGHTQAAAEYRQDPSTA